MKVLGALCLVLASMGAIYAADTTPATAPATTSTAPATPACCGDKCKPMPGCCKTGTDGKTTCAMGGSCCEKK